MGPPVANSPPLGQRSHTVAQLRHWQVYMAFFLVATCLRPAEAQLTDAPLLLPGRPRQGGAASVSAAAAADVAEERAGYFSIPGTQRRIFYWYFQVRTKGVSIEGASLRRPAWGLGHRWSVQRPDRLTNLPWCLGAQRCASAQWQRKAARLVQKESKDSRELLCSILPANAGPQRGVGRPHRERAAHRLAAGRTGLQLPVRPVFR